MVSNLVLMMELIWVIYLVNIKGINMIVFMFHFMEYHWDDNMRIHLALHMELRME